MDASSDEVDYLTSQILSSKEPVTYHSLSRELNIHSDYAKRILYDFYKSNKDKLTASFIITGKDKQGKTLIKLSENENLLANDMSAYSKINTIHVYCVVIKGSPITSFDISALELKYPIDHESIDQYVKNGLIEGPKLSKVKNIGKPAPIAIKADSPNTMKAESSTPSSSAKPTKSATLTSGYVSRKASNNPSPASSTKSDHSSSLYHYVSRKTPVAETKKSTKRPKPESSGYVYQSRKAQKQEPKERVVISNVDDDNDDDDNKIEKYAQPPSKFTTSELENLFIDDFSDDDAANDTVQDHPEAEPIIIEEAETEDVKGEIPVVETTPSVDEPKEKSPFDVTTRLQSSTKATPEAEPEVEVAPRETTIDEDGYITSYRAKKPETKLESRTPIKKSTPLGDTKKQKSDNKNKKQASLMSFFKSK